MQSIKKVVIVGAGFAGVQLALSLDARHFELYLVDKINYHQFQPLFYQVATSQLEPSSISFPLRYIFRKHPHVHLIMDESLSFDHHSKTLHTRHRPIAYDSLVLALGCKTNFFGNEQIERHSFTLKSTREAIALRNHLLSNLEQYTLAKDPEQKALLGHVVIVGAGPTGVEMAGALAEIKSTILPKDYPGVDFSAYTIYLVDGGKLPLAAMSRPAQEAAFEYLTAMGVKVLPQTVVKACDGRQVMLSNGETILTNTVLWSAGVTPNSIQGVPADSMHRSGRILVDRHNQVVGLQGEYALGDLALMHTPKYPNGQPQVANVAINQAKLLARNLKCLETNKPLAEYEYQDLGSMATIGKHKAVVDFPFIKFKGYWAWFVWMSVHLMLILSVRNKLIIFINWACTYLTKDSSLRLIFDTESSTKNTND